MEVKGNFSAILIIVDAVDVQSVVFTTLLME